MRDEPDRFSSSPFWWEAWSPVPAAPRRPSAWGWLVATIHVGREAIVAMLTHRLSNPRMEAANTTRLITRRADRVASARAVPGTCDRSVCARTASSGAGSTNRGDAPQRGLFQASAFALGPMTSYASGSQPW